MPDAFIFDANRCTGCHACRLACSIENQLEPEQGWRRIETFNPDRHPVAPVFHLSLACHHCAEPACMHACPALAYSRDVTGAVLIDPDKCIGCGYCSWACPYDAPVFDEGAAVMTKCTLCAHRLQSGMKPACAALCPTGALDFGDVPEAELTQDVPGFPRTGLAPRIKIVPLRPGRQKPEMTEQVPVEDVPAQTPPSRISLQKEWSLALFTLLASTLVGVVAGHVSGTLTLGPASFLGLAGLTFALATAHLGRPARALRAVFNLRRSWLSREIASLTAFAALALVYLVLASPPALLGGVVIALGLLSLFIADRVYSVIEINTPAYAHSASVLWTGLLLAALFADVIWLAASLLALKALLYVGRKLPNLRSGHPLRPALTLARSTLGFVVPGLLWLSGRGDSLILIATCILVAELIDRCEYYDELETESPAHRLALDLTALTEGAG